ncbi:MAG: hypothetical protein AAGJ18_01485 [Bacteroidota bacterium]
MIIKLIDGDEVNTSESYNKHVFVSGNNIIIPYISLQLMERVRLLDIDEFDKINYSYLILNQVFDFAWTFGSINGARRNRVRLTESQPDNPIINYFTGADFESSHSGCEFKACFNGIYLFVPNEFRKKNSLEGWVPQPTPAFFQNMLKEEVKIFFRKESIPKEILVFLRIDNLKDIRILELLGHPDKEVEQDIADSWVSCS